MKRKNLIIGSTSLAIIATLIVVFTFNLNSEKSYSPLDLSVLQKQQATDAQLWLAARYVDLETGERITDEKLRLIMQESKNIKRSAFVFEELGPDNIGGRTRAIQIDRANVNNVWAGGVSGGLFFSSNGANSWTRVDEFPGLPYISSMTQTIDGTVFVATGSFQEGWNGDGLYYKSPNSITWNLVPGSASFSNISEVVCSDVENVVYMATTNGLKKWTVGAAAVDDVIVQGGNGACNALQMSADGQVIITTMGGTGKVFVSSDGGANFNNSSGLLTDNKIPAGSPRTEFAISKTKNASNAYTLYVVRTDNNLKGMHVSSDNGNTWNQFVGASGTPSNLDIYRDQGTYNSIVSVDPTDSERILLGGIDIWEWRQTVNNPPAGGFYPKSQWFLPPTSPLYVHADNHEMKWDSNNRLYIGNDGGIGISLNKGETFYPANRGYNVTQFYGIAMDRNGAVMGGAQDNGTLYNDFSSASYKEFTEVGGGDGFECEISFFNPKVMFSSVYYNSVSRSGDKGQSFSGFEPPYPSSYGSPGSGSTAFPFHTEFVLAEYYDLNSKDSVTFSAKKNYAANSIVRVASLSSGDTINYVTPTALYYNDTVYATASLTVTDNKVVNTINNGVVDLGQSSYTFTNDIAPAGLSTGDTLLVNGSTTVAVGTITPYTHYFAQHPITNQIVDLYEDNVAFNISWSTVRVADPYQSWFLVYTAANGGELYGTRDALRFSVNTKWVKFVTGIGGGLYSSIDIEFSRDLNSCFISCGSGVYRINGMGNVYTSSSTFDADIIALGTAKVKIANQSCEGIAVNPNNADDLILLQGFSGNILRSSNASSSAGLATFSSLTNLGAVAAYDAIIDVNNSDIIVVGTALGVRVSDDGGTSWEDASAGFENVPVYEVRQNWRTWAEGCTRNGEIYLGTFGRGIWASSTLLGLGEENSPKADYLKTKLKVYPNPATSVTTLSFNQIKTGNVSVKVYNLSGVMVKNINLKNLEKGQQTIDIPVSDLSNGAYVVKFSSSSYDETIKFIKM